MDRFNIIKFDINGLCRRISNIEYIEFSSENMPTKINCDNAIIFVVYLAGHLSELNSFDFKLKLNSSNTEQIFKFYNDIFLKNVVKIKFIKVNLK